MRRVADSSLLSLVTALGRETLRVVLPSSCVVCGHELPWRARRASCCQRCWDELPRITAPKCSRCAIPWTGDGQIGSPFICIECRTHPRVIECTDSWGRYAGGLEQVLQALKFRRHDFLAGPLASLLFETFEARGDRAFDAAVPVPMHRARLRSRGYNQAELLARAFSQSARIPLRKDLLRKRRATESQSTLPRDERRKNVRGAFLSGPAAKDQSILLIDDVCTTGETLRACADALLQAGAARVCALTVARTC